MFFTVDAKRALSPLWSHHHPWMRWRLYSSEENTDWLLDKHRLSLKASDQRAMVRESDAKILVRRLKTDLCSHLNQWFWCTRSPAHTPTSNPSSCLCQSMSCLSHAEFYISLYPLCLSVCYRQQAPRDRPYRVQCPLLARRPPPNRSWQKSRNRRSGRPLNCLTRMGLDSLMSRSSK